MPLIPLTLNRHQPPHVQRRTIYFACDNLNEIALPEPTSPAAVNESTKRAVARFRKWRVVANWTTLAQLQLNFVHHARCAFHTNSLFRREVLAQVARLKPVKPVASPVLAPAYVWTGFAGWQTRQASPPADSLPAPAANSAASSGSQLGCQLRHQLLHLTPTPALPPSCSEDEDEVGSPDGGADDGISPAATWLGDIPTPPAWPPMPPGLSRPAGFRIWKLRLAAWM